MPTARVFRKKAFHCSLYEAQDVLVESGDVDLIRLTPGVTFGMRDLWQRRLIHRDLTNTLVLRNTGLKRVRLRRRYDLFLAACQTYEDLLYVNAIENWKDMCKTSVCWIEEIWARSLHSYRHWLRLFEQFDHVFMASTGTVDALSKAIGKPCGWMPMAVDTLRFTPYPSPPPRVIDVYSIGRRWPGVHRAVLQLAAEDDLFYVFDTLHSQASTSDVYDCGQHRDLLAAMAQRSRFFLVSPSKFDAADETQGQVEFGQRYFEGAAAGAILIGRRPRMQQFDVLFDWPDAVVEIETDGSNIGEVVRGLRADPVRAATISRRNAAEALLRHDWIHRWKQILETVGLAPSAGIARREQRLKALARSCDQRAVHGGDPHVVCRRADPA